MRVFFDLDGTLLNIADRHYSVYSFVTKKYGGKPLTKRNYWSLKRNKISIEEILKRSLISIEKTNSFLNNFIKLIESPRYLDLDHLFPRVLDILDEMILNGCDLYLVSFRRSKSSALRQMNKLGLTDRFKSILVGRSDKDGVSTKVDFICQISSSPGDIVVGDTEDDILSAKKIGLISVAVLSGIRNKQHLEKYNPEYIIKDINFLPNIIKIKKC